MKRRLGPFTCIQRQGIGTPHSAASTRSPLTPSWTARFVLRGAIVLVASAASGCMSAEPEQDSAAQSHHSSQNPAIPKADGPGSGTFIIDNGSGATDHGFESSTAWWPSSSVSGFVGSNYHSAAVDQVSDPAVWWFKLTSARCLSVDARWTAGANRSANLKYRIVKSGGVELGSREVDQRSSGARWNKLGDYTFPAGRNRIELSRWASGEGFAIADAVRLSPCGQNPGNETPPNPTPPSSSGVKLSVPYFYQYENANEPGATCGITSAAMLVNRWYAGQVTPDGLYYRYGKSKGQSPEALASLYQAEGLKSRYSRSGTRAQVRAHLDAGRPVVVHGFWTGPGHVAVIVGYDSKDWIVHDPAGDWEQCYGCGYGKYVRYSRQGAWDNKLSVDGDIWYSTASTSGF